LFVLLFFLPRIKAQPVTVIDRLPVGNKNVPAVLAVCRFRPRRAGKPAVEVANLINVLHKTLRFGLAGPSSACEHYTGTKKNLVLFAEHKAVNCYFVCLFLLCFEFEAAVDTQAITGLCFF